jgi:hypothetical protein
MLVGVKYCGGCNPTYDRGAAFREVRRALSEGDGQAGPIRFVFAADGGSYDVLLVVNGCSNRCADISEFFYKELIYMWKPGQAESVAEALRAKQESMYKG